MARLTTWRCDRCKYAEEATSDRLPTGWTLLTISGANPMDLCTTCDSSLERWVAEPAPAPAHSTLVDEVAELLKVPAHRKMYRALAERSPTKVLLVDLAKEFGQRPRTSGAFLACLRVAAEAKGVPITSLIRTERVMKKGHTSGLTSAWIAP
jgi:hypothetical protein